MPQQILRIDIARLKCHNLPQDFSRAGGVVKLFFGNRQKVERGRVARAQTNRGLQFFYGLLIAAEIE